MPKAVDNPCGAKTRNSDAKGPTCTNPAGFRTDHPKVGKCYLHDGGGLSHSSITHGRTSKILNTSIGQAIQRYSEDPEPLNIEYELAAARALFEKWVLDFEEWDLMLKAWFQDYTGVRFTPERIESLDYIITDYESLSPETERSDITQAHFEVVKEVVKKLLKTMKKAERPYRYVEIDSGIRIISEITKIVARIEKIRAENAISKANFLRVMAEMGRVVNAVVTDETQKKEIHARWLDIRLEAK